MNERSHFQRGHGVFNCHLCTRRTRGSFDSVGCDLCEQCFELCGQDNYHNDNAVTPNAEDMEQYNGWLKIIGDRGGDIDRVRSHCGYIWNESTMEFCPDWGDV